MKPIDLQLLRNCTKATLFVDLPQATVAVTVDKNHISAFNGKLSHIDDQGIAEWKVREFWNSLGRKLPAH